MDGSFLFGIAEIAALVVFVMALVQGKGFWNAVRMSAGVLILGFVAVLALGLLFGVIKLATGLLMVALWVGVVYALVVVVAKAVAGSSV